MSSKTVIVIGGFIGSSLGSYLPMIWGDNAFSLSSIFLSLVGGLAGIYVGYRINKDYL